MYKKSIEPLHDQEAENWEAMEKDWNRYKFDGYGYEGYNKELYATYVFEEANPLLDVANPIAEAASALRSQRLGDGIRPVFSHRLAPLAQMFSLWYLQPFSCLNPP